MRRLLIAVICLMLFTGCARFVKSEISVFHELPSSLGGMSYTIIPFKEQEGSLEYKAYERSIKQELDAKGFRETSLENTDVVILFSYGIDTGKEVVLSYPIIGQTGVSSSSTYGTIQSYGSYGTYSGTTTYTPTYGVVGTGVASHTQYTRFLKVDILNKTALSENKITKIYEAKVISRGSGGQLPAVLPAMIKSLFADFPGKSGSTRISTHSLK